MPTRTLLVTLALAMSLTAGAQTSTVVDLPSRSGVTQRILYVSAPNPSAIIVHMPGGNGVLGIQPDGSMPTTTANCSPFARNRAAFAGRGYALALVDQASDGSTYRFEDVYAAVRYARTQANVPVFVTGGSNSTQGTWDMAVDLPASLPVGVVFFSPGMIDTSRRAEYVRPTLVVTHNSDPGQYAGYLFPALANAKVEAVAFSGGSAGGCGYHLFQGLDSQFVSAVGTFIDKYTPLFPKVETVTAVEYYNAALDHYFLTHVAAEIAILDAGVTIKGWTRTGQTFDVFAAPTASTSPVCRFYIPPDKGNSHFYGRGASECNATGTANPTFVLEDPQFFHITLPVAGACPAGARPIYRVFSNRPDANHRYMVDAALRDAMVAKGWIAEGDGADRVVMCGP